MANSIHGKEAVEQISKVWGNLTKQITSTVDVLKEYQKTTQKLPSDYLNSLNKIKESQNDLNTSTEKAIKVQTQATAEQKEAARIAKLTASTKAKITKATTKEAKALTKLKIELANVTKEEKQRIQLSSKLTGKYTKQSVTLNRLRAKYKDVALAQGESSNAAKRLETQITRLDRRLKRVDASVGQFGRVVGNYPKLLGGATASLRSFAAAFGFTSAIFILAQTVRNAVGIFKQFNQSQADLSAILGRSQGEISALTDQAKLLGATTAFTATQVAELQLELAKLGFNDQEILNATLGIENLAIATGVDAARAAKLGGSALRGFSLDASEANRVAATLAVSTTKSASTFESLEVALPKVSAIAKSFGFTIEDTTALLGGLQNAGFEASIAGTSLRQIFLQLADSNGKLAKRLGGGAKNFDELIDQFKKVEKEGISLGEAFNLTNARSVAAFKTFLSGADDLQTLRNSIVDVEDELDTLAEQKLDSVQGRITLLNSAWEGWILSLDESGEAAESLKSSIEFLTKNLSEILNTTIKLGKAFLIYKAIMITTGLVTRAYAGAVTLLRLAKILLAGGIGKATIAMKAFNLTTKASPIGILLSVLSAGIAIWAAFSSGVKEASDEVNGFGDELERASKRESDFRNRLKGLGDAFSQLQQVISSQFEVEDKLSTFLNKQGVNSARTAEAIKLVRNERSRDIETINKHIDVSGEFTDVQKKAIRTSILNMQTLRKITIELESSLNEDAEKKAEEKAKLDKKRLKDIFSLEQSRLKRQIEIANDLSNNEKKSTEERFVANKVSLEKRLELLELERNFAIRNAAGRTSKITQINEEFEHNKTKLAEKGSKERIAILNSDFKKRVKLFSDLQSANQTALIDQENKILESNLKRGSSVAETEEALTAIRRNAREEQLQNEIDFALKELQIASFTAEQKAEVEKKLTKLKAELLGIEFEDKKDAEQDELDRLKRREEAVRGAFQGIGDALGISGDNLATIFNGIENGFKNSGEAAVAYGQLATQVFDSVINAQNAQLENQITALEKEKETALLFAGKSDAAKQQIEDQFNERKAKLQQKQAENQKQADIVNSIVGTASAVVSALGARPFTPANFALAATVGVIGAAQTAIIASQKIPQFKDGVTDFGGGLAVLGDGGVSEVVRTPDGSVFATPSKDTLYDLPKGTDVFKNKTDFNNDLNKTLNDNNIYHKSITPGESKNINIVNKGVSAKEMDQIIGKHFSSLTSNNIVFDENGIKKFIRKGNGATVLHNNRVTFKGTSV